MLRTPLPNEARQRMDRGQSLVAGRHATVTPLLHVVKKQPDVLGRDVIDLKLIDCFVGVRLFCYDASNPGFPVSCPVMPGNEHFPPAIRCSGGRAFGISENLAWWLR